MSHRPLAEPAPAAAHPPALVSVVRRPLGPSTKSNVAPVAPSTGAPTNAIKTLIKLEDRLSKAEAKIHDLQREKVTAQNELGDLQTELRLAAQREAKLKHSLEKWEKSHASLKEKSSKLFDLQARLGELHKVHEESKARRQKEIDDLSEKLKKEEERRKHDLAEARRSITSEQTKAQEYQTKCAAIEAELQHLRLQGSVSSDILQQKQTLIEELQTQRDSDKIIAIDAQKYARKIEVELNQQIEQLRAQIETKLAEAARSLREQQAATEAARSQLESELDELSLEVDQTEQQHAHNLAVVAKAVSHHIDALQQRSSTQQNALRLQWHRNASERITLETLADERAAQIHELVAVVKQVQDDRDAAKQLVSTLQSDLVSITAELSAERQLATLLIEQQEEQQHRSAVSTSASFGDLSGLTTALGTDDAAASLLQGELEDVRARNHLLQEETADLQARLLTRSSEAKAAEEALSTVRTQVATLEASVAAKTREVNTLVAQLSELEPLRKRLSAALDEAATARKEAQSHAEAARSLTASLQNARVAEKAWRDERDRMASLLDQAEQFESLYHELAEQTKHLVERNALAEEEKATLSALNSELLSHSNPNQKIVYMDRVRHELDDVKQDNLGLRLQLERLEEENRQLARELSSYKAVDVPLSQRPRAEVTRVLRATDHEGLLRQVSGSIEAPPVRVAAHALPHIHDRTAVSTPVRSTFGAPMSKTPFSVHGPRFTAVPLQPELQRTLQAEEKRPQTEQVDEKYGTGAEALPHPPLPMDTGLSPKKRRSYGNLSVHATEEAVQDNDSEESLEDDTLLPLPAVADPEEAVAEAEVAIRRNRPRPTLVNSGALRVGTQLSSIPLPVATTAPAPVARDEPTNPVVPPTNTVGGGAARRPSLTTSTLGIKARRVSELVRASTPPLPSIADFSHLDTPNNLLLDTLPSPSPYGLADWTATDETSHVPGLNPHRASDVVHSTPLAAPRPRFRKSRYSGAQRVPQPDATPKGRRGLLPPARQSGALVAVSEATGTVYEDEHDSFRKGWLYDDEEEPIDLPDFSIEPNRQTTQQTKKQKSKAKGRASMKVKPGPMARTFFR